MQNLNTLKFFPQVKKDIKARLKEKSVNEIICEEMGLSGEESRSVHFNADFERFTLNLDGIRYVI